MRSARRRQSDCREELDRIAESFLRRADGLIAAELQQAITVATQRLDDRLVQLARQHEAEKLG